MKKINITTAGPLIEDFEKDGRVYSDFISNETKEDLKKRAPELLLEVEKLTEHWDKRHLEMTNKEFNEHIQNIIKTMKRLRYKLGEDYYVGVSFNSDLMWWSDELDRLLYK